MTMPRAGWFALAAVVCFGAGWLTGGAGRSAVDLERRDAVERAGLDRVRAETLAGRVALYETNFGQAAQRFGAAVEAAREVQAARRALSRAEAAGRLEPVLTHLQEAQRLAAAISNDAHGAASQALAALAAAR